MLVRLLGYGSCSGIPTNLGSESDVWRINGRACGTNATYRFPPYRRYREEDLMFM